MPKLEDKDGSVAHRLKVYKAARKFARSIAGADQTTYLSILAAAQLVGEDVHRVKVVPVQRKTQPESEVAESTSIDGQPRRLVASGPANAQTPPTAFSIPNVRDHALRVLNRAPIRTAIVGGAPTGINDFLDCVALGSASGRWCCTGTLIHSRMVLTAGHCLDADCCSFVFVGSDTRGFTFDSSSPQVYRVQNRFRHPQFEVTARTLTSGNSVDVYENDLLIAVLDRDVANVIPRRIAPDSATSSATGFRAVGFGITDSLASDSGLKREVEVASISNSCSATDSSSTGCVTNFEIVAGSMNRDTCNGDSGGPLYSTAGGRFFLSGVTSRGATATCGQGGIYVRVDKYLDFIQSVAAQNGLVIIT